MIYCFDLDGTICSIVPDNNYPLAEPFIDVINKINELYKDNIIKIFTARGASSGKDWTQVTEKQLSDWGLKYHELIMNKKPSFDLFIDDKAISASCWRKKNIKSIRGVIAGSFDIVHPGYIKMFAESKNYCDHLTVLLHEDPSKIKKEKIKPILSLEERKEILNSIKYIDEIITYQTENDLSNILTNNLYDVRILGDDYKNKKITSPELTKKIIFINRNHDWSTTKFKKMIYENFKGYLNVNT